jgi:1,4-dihydroxy-2-naphthoate octaprenyltransferase
MSSTLSEYFLATRPWSFTAALVPILVTAAVLGAPIISMPFFRSLAIGVTIQAAANLTNTYYDYINGVDTLMNTGEKTLCAKKVSTAGLLTLMISCYIIGTLAVLPVLLETTGRELMVIFAAGVFLAFFYTANPIGLKYCALGDITIFLCFGPLLMQCTAIILTGKTHSSLHLYSIPIGLLTEAILHANNARDIKADKAAGATTLATLIGFNNSFIVYALLFIGAYAGILYIALFYHWGCLASLITVPLAFQLCVDYSNNKMLELPDGTAKMHLPCGILLFLGIIFTSNGLVEKLLL